MAAIEAVLAQLEIGQEPRFESQVRHDEQYESNYQEMKRLVFELEGILAESQSEGSEGSIERHHKRGQLLARERVHLLLDEDSPFLELCPLVGYGQEDQTLGGNTVAGLGIVAGVECMILASVPTIKGGTVNAASIQKGQRVYEIASENCLPIINLLQSGGADLSQQAAVFHRGGGSFRNQAIRSKAGMTSFAVVFGSSTAGGAYAPGMSDYVIMVKNQARVFLGGPPLVKMATGEVVDEESLGGAEMHSRKSGLCDYLAIDEISAIRKCRELVHHLHWEKKGTLPLRHLRGAIEEPAYDVEELLGIVPANIRIPFDIREVIARVVDGSRFSEFKPLYGPGLVTVFSHIHGIPVGIIANNGVFFPPEANKATQFIQLCNQKSSPIIFLHNITGFMVGKKYEEEGIIKAGARFINAVSNSQVPHISVNVAASYGAGNYAMCGRAYRPRFLFSWPNSKCSVMGAEQLTGVLDIVARSAAEQRGITLDEDFLAQRKQSFYDQVEAEGNVYYTSSRGLDDAVIDPRDTRIVLGFCLSFIYSEKVQGGNLYGVARM